MVILEKGCRSKYESNYDLQAYHQALDERLKKITGGDKNGEGLTIADSIVLCDDCCCLFQIEEKDVEAGKVNERFFTTGIPVLTTGGRNNLFRTMKTVTCPDCASPVIFLFED